MRRVTPFRGHKVLMWRHQFDEIASIKSDFGTNGLANKNIYDYNLLQKLRW